MIPSMLPADFVLPHPDEFERVRSVSTWTNEQLEAYAAQLERRHDLLASEAELTGEARYRRMISINAEIAHAVHAEIDRRTQHSS